MSRLSVLKLPYLLTVTQHRSITCSVPARTAHMGRKTRRGLKVAAPVLTAQKCVVY